MNFDVGSYVQKGSVLVRLDPRDARLRLEQFQAQADQQRRAVDQAIAGQPDAWAKYLAGERKALGAIVGQVMKATKGQADGKLVNEIVERRARS